MLADNIRSNRKRINLSQDELAEKVGVSRQSVSFWETGQTQPTIENIIALSKIFNISSDMLLGNTENTSAEHPESPKNAEQNSMPQNNGKKSNMRLIVFCCVIIALAVGVAVYAVVMWSKQSGADASDASYVVSSAESTDSVDEGTVSDSEADASDVISSVSDEVAFDLFTYCKDFAIQIGVLNGDYCIYQQPSSKYGGYDGEYFSISYWADSNMVEFCLHCPLDEATSHNFYLRMRGGYNGKYEYTSSKYYRDTGESFRYATGYIDPSIFYDGYPIGCDVYEGDIDGQDQFMEDSRVGICDLIRCLKQFTAVENMDCDFSDFEFVNFK